MAEKRNIAIVHFNTPELTEACIKSIRKHDGEDYQIFLFDNSTTRPFKHRMKGIKLFNNTKGKYINFDKELEKFPGRIEKIGDWANCGFGSAKHQMSVQKLWELINEPFLLVESDVLITKPLDEFFSYPDYATVGYKCDHQKGNKFELGRMMPMLCWMNVPVLQENGAKYFDPTRTYGLLPNANDKNNWYDTGATLLYDVMRLKPALKGRHLDIRDYMIHYVSASWKGNNLTAQLDWLDENKEFFDSKPKTRKYPNSV